MGDLLAVIRRGDSTSHGGKVIEGFPDGHLGVDGIAAAGLGHAVSCPKHAGPQRIAEGESSFRVRGVPIALEGMVTTCGAVLIPSQYRMKVERRQKACLADIKVFVGGEAGGQGPGTSETHPYDQRFQLADEANGEPLANRFYRIRVQGAIYEGRTDSQGCSQRISAGEAHMATIEIFGEGV